MSTQSLEKTITRNSSKRKFRRSLSEIFNFSYGVHAKTVDTGKWDASIYSDPATFQAHLGHHFKCTCEIIEGKFTFFSVQDRTMTQYVRRILREMLQLKEANLLKGTTMKVFDLLLVNNQSLLKRFQFFRSFLYLV